MSKFQHINGNGYPKNQNPLIPALSKCCNATVRVKYKELIPGTGIISKETDFFYCDKCKSKLNQQTMEPLT